LETLGLAHGPPTGYAFGEDKDQGRVIRISIDAMGGDFGPEVVIAGAAKALERHPDVTFLIYGLKAECEPVLAKYPKLRDKSVFYECELAVSMEEKPSAALRRGRYISTMWRSIEAVKLGEAEVVVSAGNTGALMAMAKFCLRTMANIERPAIAGIWPTLKGESIVLDIGATIGADAQQLLDFGIMGGAMSRALFGIRPPDGRASQRRRRRGEGPGRRQGGRGRSCVRPNLSSIELSRFRRG
jgi:glycerol-3-phosphate acyltransferase PlsX